MHLGKADVAAWAGVVLAQQEFAIIIHVIIQIDNQQTRGRAQRCLDRVAQPLLKFTHGVGISLVRHDKTVDEQFYGMSLVLV